MIITCIVLGLCARRSSHRPAARKISKGDLAYLIYLAALTMGTAALVGSQIAAL